MAGRAIVLDGSASEMRRSLGPRAWLVFEELLLTSEPAANGRQASVSVRSVAASLGLANDTTAQAIRRLCNARLVSASQHRTASGAFDIGTYCITVPSAINVVESKTPPHRVARPEASQLSLLIEP